MAALVGGRANMTIITAEEIEELLAHEKQREVFACDGEEATCLADLGDVSNADLLLSSKLGKVGTSLVLHLTLLEPKTSKVRGRGTVTCESSAELLELLPHAVEEAFGVETSAAEKPAFAIDKPNAKAAVFPLAGHNVGADVAASLTQVVALELRRQGGLQVISQDEIAAMLQLEAQKDELGCSDTTCFAEIGGALGVDYLVVGNVGRLEDTFMANLKLIETKKAEVKNRASETFKGREQDLLRATKFATYSLVGTAVTDTGRLVLKVTPEDAQLTIDGEERAAGDQSARLAALSPGRHALRLDHEDYYSTYLETYVEPGATNTLLLTLEALPLPWYKKWWVWTVSAAVLGGAAFLTARSLSGGEVETGTVALSVTREAQP